MPGSLLDAQRVVASDRHPRDPGRAQVVEGDVLLAIVVCEQLGALHAGLREMLAEERGAVLVVGHPERGTLDGKTDAPSG